MQSLTLCPYLSKLNAISKTKLVSKGYQGTDKTENNADGSRSKEHHTELSNSCEKDFGVAEMCH